MSAACIIRSLGLLAITGLTLGGCAGGLRETRHSQPPPAQAVSAAHEGKPFEVVPGDSLLTIRVYRGGSLSRMGHNHLVASHDLAGVVYVPEDLTRASFEVRFPVAKLTVDEAELRAQEGPDFPAEVPDAAKEGTRHNMLGEGLLDAGRFPEIVLVSESIEVIAPNELLVHVRVTVRDRATSVVVPVHYAPGTDGLTATGEFVLKHSELGLTPFSVMMGAMQVQDEMKVRLRIHCASSSASSALAP